MKTLRGQDLRAAYDLKALMKAAVDIEEITSTNTNGHQVCHYHDVARFWCYAFIDSENLSKSMATKSKVSVEGWILSNGSLSISCKSLIGG